MLVLDCLCGPYVHPSIFLCGGGVAVVSISIYLFVSCLPVLLAEDQAPYIHDTALFYIYTTGWTPFLLLPSFFYLTVGDDLIDIALTSYYNIIKIRRKCISHTCFFNVFCTWFIVIMHEHTSKQDVIAYYY